MLNARKEISELSPYSSPRIIEVEIKLNQNESPYNLPLPLIKKIQERIGKLQFNRYNEGSSERLRVLVAKKLKKFNVLPSQVIFGVGIDELLYYLMLTFISKGDKVVRPVPSFSMYEICSKIAGAVDLPIKLGKNFELSDEFVRESKDARVVFICRPNNPTSNSFSKATIEKIIQETKGIVCIDEAYAEFAKEDCLDFLKYDNVIIMRTFSKAYSCAGVRLGYAISSPKIIDLLNRVRLPWNVSVVSQIIGEVVLENEEFFSEKISEIKQNKDLLVRSMNEFVDVLPSDCNFIAFKVKNPRVIFEKLLKKSILVRDISKYPMLGEFLRVNVGTKQENEKFIAALQDCIPPDGIIFDIDGVLVDVSKSYREAIKQTAKAIRNIVVSDADINQIKMLPNSNNDWDVAYSLIYGTKDLKSINRTTSNYAKVKAKFQELYLGGLCNLETSIADPSVLKSLVFAGYKLGVVTSRPREEARYALNRMIPSIFDPNFVIALEDCAAEKPSPEPLLLAKKRMNCKNAIYVGDTINDALSAKAAGIKFISVVPGLNSGCTIKDVNKIQEVL